MPAKFVNIDRLSPMLLPCDLTEWVKGNDLVHFIIEVVETCDLSRAHVNHSGRGSSQYPPGMMLTLLIYSYATGVFSSRKIERATYDSVSVRYICANHHPDHDTIAVFRRRNLSLLEDVFLHVLNMASEMKLLNLGTISVDGTKIKGNASDEANRTIAQIEDELEQLKKVLEERLEQAELADSQEDQQGEFLPESMRNATERKEKLQKAKQALEQKMIKLEQRKRKSQDRYKPKPEDRIRKQGAGKKPHAKISKMRMSEMRKRKQINTTDPESGAMPTRKKGFVQGFNAQAAVSVGAVNLIVSGYVCNEPNDHLELTRMTELLQKESREPENYFVADKGYYSSLEIDALEQSRNYKLIIPPTHSPARSSSSRRYGKNHPRAKMARLKRKMLKRFKTHQGKQIYQARNFTSEGCFATVKNAMGFTQFSLRGLKGANIEWELVKIAHNCRKLCGMNAVGV